MPLSFRPPQKAILSQKQLDAFQDTPTCNRIIEYIEALNKSITGLKLTDDCSKSENVEAVLRVLDRVKAIAEQTPPVDNSASRFGNPAFRTFLDKVGEESEALHKSIPTLPHESILELSGYFNNAWGNRTRIDYGSGMELNFLCWLMCLEHLGILTPEDHSAIILKIFWKYISVMRILQSSYWLEPAGSHGVWGLDDYHFLPFLFGSGQLIGHKYIKPKAIHDPEIVNEYAKNYMYFACIQFINSIKTASLRWHSPMLNDISSVKTWDKVNGGMIKMYKGEVLGKLPVIQHFLFGSILPYEGPPLEGAEPDETHGHVHGPGATGWGDCCGIPVPSAFAEAQKSREPGKALSGPAIRPVPFD